MSDAGRGQLLRSAPKHRSVKIRCRRKESGRAGGAPREAFVYIDYSGRECESWAAVIDLPDGRTLELAGELNKIEGIRNCEHLAYLHAKEAVEKLGIKRFGASRAIYLTDEAGLAQREGLRYISRQEPLHRRAHELANQARRELEQHWSPARQARAQGLPVPLDPLPEDEQVKVVRNHKRLTCQVLQARQGAYNKQAGSKASQKAWMKLQRAEQALRDFICWLQALVASLIGASAGATSSY